MTKLNQMAYEDCGEISRIDLQLLATLQKRALNQAGRALDRLKRQFEEVRHNRRDHTAMTTDVLMHRSALLAKERPLKAPGTDFEIPVDTPTNGEPVTDEQMLWDDFGLNLSIN